MDKHPATHGFEQELTDEQLTQRELMERGMHDAGSSRRAFLLASLGLLAAGCASGGTISRLPGPVWDRTTPPPSSTPTPLPPAVPSRPVVAGVVPRSQWALSQPVPSLMNRMTPVRYITVHHDGMSPFIATDAKSAQARLESIRRAHRNNGWGDIGYHFAIDRAGRVYECRQLGWQGAHVKDRNPGNIGICTLGNFDQQAPTQAQVEGLRKHVAALMRQHRVDTSRVKTHQEWNATACPGTNLQRYMVNLRHNGGLT